MQQGTQLPAQAATLAVAGSGAGEVARGMIGPRLLVAGPAAFLLVFFVIPNAFLLTTSFLKSEDQVLTDQVTLDNFVYLLTKPLYLRAILRSFWISATTGALVVLLAFPLAYYLARTASRWRGALIAMALAPLLASVVVRTYGWWGAAEPRWADQQFDPMA